MRLSEIKNEARIFTEIENPVFEKEYDVIVCGLGTAGSLAALFSAEKGLSVLGTDTFNCVGGVHTAGGVMQHYFENPGGKYEAIENEVKSFAKKHTVIEAEARKLIAEEKLVKSGVEILYETITCGVYLEEKTLVGLKIFTGKKFINIKAKIIMDCTADAHIAHLAGCESELGRGTDNQSQPYTSVSLVYDGNNYSVTNFDYGRVNQTDDKNFSETLIYARSNEKRVERYGGRKMVAHLPLLGMREGRRIVADETVTTENIFKNEQSKTPMFYSYADMDKHGLDTAFDGEALSDWAIGANLGAYNVTVAVPYKTILPKNYDALLVPCRALGVSREVACCVRMIPDMKKMAEAAAEWAYLSISQDKKLREVDYEELKKELVKSGCLDINKKIKTRVDGNLNWDTTPLEKRDVEFITDPEKLEAVLKTEAPGEAIWSAGLIGEKAVPVLEKLLTSDDENTRKHSAFALAMLGNDKGTEILRETVRSRDGLMLKDCRKKNNYRGVMAIYWLGRLADAESVDILSEIISGEEEFRHPTYLQRDPTTFYIADYRGIYFQFVSHSVMALIRIGDRHKNLRKKISDIFRNTFSDDRYYNRITKNSAKSSEGNCALTIKAFAVNAVEKWEKEI